MILQDVDDKYDKKNTLPFLANCKTRSLFWHLKNMADRGYGLRTSRNEGGSCPKDKQLKERPYHTN